MVPISFAYLARFTKGLRCDFKLTWHEQICKLCKVGMIWGDHQSPHRSPLLCSPLCKVAPMLANPMYGCQGCYLDRGAKLTKQIIQSRYDLRRSSIPPQKPSSLLSTLQSGTHIKQLNSWVPWVSWVLNYHGKIMQRRYNFRRSSIPLLKPSLPLSTLQSSTKSNAWVPWVSK